MPRGPDVLNVEREKVLQESRRHNNMRQTSADIMYVEGEQRSKKSFANNEEKLRALAAAEKARREAAKPPTRPKTSVRSSQAVESAQPKPMVKSQSVVAPQVEAKAEVKADGKVSTVVKVHPDGTFDLQLGSGEIMEKLDKSWWARLKLPPREASSRPGTGQSRPATGFSRPGTGLSRPATSGPAASTVQYVDLTDANGAAAVADGVAPVVNLDDTLAGIGRRGGRATLGARRAAQSEISSLLSWD